MIRNLIRYSAPVAKVRGMYGKLLTPSQWERLSAAETMRDVREVLRDCPGWALETQSDDPCDVTAALWNTLSGDCRRLGFYLNEADRQTLDFILRRREKTPTPEEYQRWLCKGSGSGFSANSVMGAEADVLNLVYILRLRRFPKSAEKAEKYLIPVRNKLTPRLRERILRGKTDGQVLDILSQTPWRDTFKSLEPGELEKQYQRAMIAYCRRVMTAGQPGLEVLQAFLVLKDMERRRLVRIAGAVSRGIDPHAV